MDRHEYYFKKERITQPLIIIRERGTCRMDKI
jgi:hypothetical protein